MQNIQPAHGSTANSGDILRILKFKAVSPDIRGELRKKLFQIISVDGQSAIGPPLITQRRDAVSEPPSSPNPSSGLSNPRDRSPIAIGLWLEPVEPPLNELS